MRKWMVPLLFLLTVLLLISFAFLPVLAGALQDAGVEKTVSGRPLHSITPYISENGSGLLILDKLQILQVSEVNSIVPAMASMDEQQVRAAVEAGLQPYIEAGVIRSPESWKFHTVPYVAISWQDAAHWFLFWEVSLMEASGDIQHSLSITVDDETGKFLMLDSFDPYAKADWQSWDEACVPLGHFSRIWLEQAGLWDSARQVTSELASQQIQGMHPGICVAVYELGGEGESPMYINFSVTDYGEYTMWIESMPQ